MESYTVKTALEALDLNRRSELARVCGCTVQNLYKGGELTAKVNHVVRLLVINKLQAEEISKLERVIENKTLIIEALR